MWFNCVRIESNSTGRAAFRGKSRLVDKIVEGMNKYVFVWTSPLVCRVGLIRYYTKNGRLILTAKRGKEIQQQ